MTKATYLLLALVVGGCGAASLSPATLQSTPVMLVIQLPAAFARSERRRDALMKRVSCLELELQTKSGHQKKVWFPPGEWAQLPLPEIAFPATPNDTLGVRVKVWDKVNDGTPRMFPVLSGSSRLRASERAVSGPSRLPLRLVLRVPISEFD